MGRALEKWTTPKVVLHPGQLSLPTKNRQQKRQGTAAVCRLKNQLLLAGTYGTGFYVLFTGTYIVTSQALGFKNYAGVHREGEVGKDG
jgi:hypothetical protein